jgi:hypothetical protein
VASLEVVECSPPTVVVYLLTVLGDVNHYVKGVVDGEHAVLFSDYSGVLGIRHRVVLDAHNKALECVVLAPTIEFGVHVHDVGARLQRHDVACEELIHVVVCDLRESRCRVGIQHFGETIRARIVQ